MRLTRNTPRSHSLTVTEHKRTMLSSVMSTVSTSPRRGRRVAALALGALAVVAVASGCSSSEDSSSDATADQTAVVDTLSSYYSAFGADDGPKACSYLDPELAAKLATTGPDGTGESAVNAGQRTPAPRR